jgi:ornithine cyclodeaminase
MHSEIDARTVADAILVTDRRESLEAEAGDYRQAVSDGVIGGTDAAAELGELLTGKRSGRTSAGQLTMFRSLGLGIEDLAAAEHALAKALETGAGVVVPAP